MGNLRRPQEFRHISFLYFLMDYLLRMFKSEEGQSRLAKILHVEEEQGAAIFGFQRWKREWLLLLSAMVSG